MRGMVRGMIGGETVTACAVPRSSMRRMHRPLRMSQTKQLPPLPPSAGGRAAETSMSSCVERAQHVMPALCPGSTWIGWGAAIS